MSKTRHVPASPERRARRQALHQRRARAQYVAELGEAWWPCVCGYWHHITEEACPRV